MSTRVNDHATLLDTVGELKAALAYLPDDMPLVGEEDGHGRLVAWVDTTYGRWQAGVTPYNPKGLDSRGIPRCNPLADAT